MNWSHFKGLNRFCVIDGEWLYFVQLLTNHHTNDFWPNWLALACRTPLCTADDAIPMCIDCARLAQHWNQTKRKQFEKCSVNIMDHNEQTYSFNSSATWYCKHKLVGSGSVYWPKSPLRIGPHAAGRSGRSHFTGISNLAVRLAITVKFTNVLATFRDCVDTRFNIFSFLLCLSPAHTVLYYVGGLKYPNVNVMYSSTV